MQVQARAAALARLHNLPSSPSISLCACSYKRVLLLSPDFIVDDSGRAFLEEVNTNGFLVGDDELFRAQADTVDLMRLVGADGWPARKLYALHEIWLLSVLSRARAALTPRRRAQPQVRCTGVGSRE